MSVNESKDILKVVREFTSDFNKETNEFAIILAAGHGKRLNSDKSKMLHTISGIPTVARVLTACTKGVEGINTIVVVGIKAAKVMIALGKRTNNAYVYQEVQNGTGHAVQIAIEGLKNITDDTIVYILPGDMGLIDAETIKQFREEFIKSEADMIVLTGLFEGKPEENYYGRIIRVKENDGNIIRIIEHKDILALPVEEQYKVLYNKKEYTYTKEELINNNEYNSGVFAFRYGKLTKMICELKSENVQSEIYLTDLIALFNEKGYTVAAASPERNYVVMGFNTQEVLKEMNEIARKIDEK